MDEPTHDKIPEGVQSLLEGLPSDRPTCSQCRVISSEEELATTKPPLRCSRCQVAHYCSSTCQRRHFDFHKHACKSIFQKRTGVEEGLAQYHSEGQGLLAADMIVAKTMIQMADELVGVGYRETDTIDNGKYYYRKALYWYLESYKCMKEDFFVPDSRQEDKLLLLVTILGGNSAHLKEWCVNSESPRFGNYKRPMIHAPGEFTTHGLAAKDTTFQFMLLLASMHSLAQYRRDVQALQVYKKELRRMASHNLPHMTPLEGISETLVLPYLIGNKKNGRTHMDNLPNDIQLVIRAIRYHGTGKYLLYLRDSIPFEPWHALDLFCGDSGPPDLPLQHTPHEFWRLYQDSVFLTRGVNDVLHEFVPEEGDDDSSGDDDE